MMTDKFIVILAQFTWISEMIMKGPLLQIMQIYLN